MAGSEDPTKFSIKKTQYKLPLTIHHEN